MIVTAAVSTSLMSAFADGSDSQNRLHIENRHNFLQLTHILVTKTAAYLRMQLHFARMCSEHNVIRLAGAKVQYNFSVENRGPLPGANTV